MMKTTAVLLLAVLLAVLAAAAESPRIIWEWNAKDGAPAGAELVRQPGRTRPFCGCVVRRLPLLQSTGRCSREKW